VAFHVLTAVTMQNVILLDMMPCHMASIPSGVVQ